MIGVVSSLEDAEAAAEFFELFKTPWEMAIPGRKYRVLLTTIEPSPHFEAEVVLAYGSGARPVNEVVEVGWEGSSLPLYAGVANVAGSTESGFLKRCDGERMTWRIGYNLFAEVRYLLDRGQPAQFALIPTLELHISVLRHLLTQSGVAFVEIPPKPDNYDFICCLTHDIDFFGIRRHRWDRTLAGFGYRATIGTLVQLIRRRRTVTEALRNWAAALSLPLVFAGVMRDFWQPFEDYADADGNRGSTFFLAPFKHLSGRAPDGAVNPVRALPYDVNDIREELANARASRTEFAVHGIDAWHNVESGQAERTQLMQATGVRRVGVRMHWLYASPDSTRCVEAAGFDYDSTCGYNDAVGFRAGTSQAFRPLGLSTLMELPLSIMDSALLYPGRMALSPSRALDLCRGILAAACRFGGAVVINWHDRSLAPERLWGRPYRELLREVEKDSRVWFATGGEAVDWFRWRRSIHFHTEDGSANITVQSSTPPAGMPAGRLVIHRPHASGPSLEETPLLGGRAICSLA
jgi:hypothetical protein